VSAH
jgi:hypothetical protein